MIDDTARHSYNTRLTTVIRDVRALPVAAADRVVTHGTRAENLMANADFAQFMHETKFDVMDELAGLAGHTDTDNARRLALGHELRGLDRMISVLQRAQSMKQRVVNSRNTQGVSSPTVNVGDDR